MCSPRLFEQSLFPVQIFIPDPNQYQSASIARQAHFLLEDKQPIPALSSVISPRVIEPPEKIPFPQADDLSKVVDVVELLSAGPREKAGIADSFQVDRRQGDYYADGAAWLGLVEKSGGSFKLKKTATNSLISVAPNDLWSWLGSLPECQCFRTARAWIRGDHPSSQEIAPI